MRLSVIAALISGLAVTAFPAQANKSHHTPEGVQAVSQQVIEAVGVVHETDSAAKKITIDHDAIVQLGWPAMRMRFTYTDDQPQFTTLKSGDKVTFTFIQQDTISLLQSIIVR